MQVGWLGDENHCWAEIRSGSSKSKELRSSLRGEMAGSDGVVRDYGREMIALTPAAFGLIITSQVWADRRTDRRSWVPATCGCGLGVIIIVRLPFKTSPTVWWRDLGCCLMTVFILLLLTRWTIALHRIA